MSKNLSDIFPPTEIGGGGGGIEEAPLTGKIYGRQSGAWEEFATGNLDDGNQDGEILTWDTATANWTHDDTMIVKGGNVGIGTSNPSNYWIQAQDLVVAGSSNEGITIATTAANGNTRLAFAGTTTGNPGLDSGGSISYSHGTDTMSVRVNGSESLTIDSTGNATFSGTVNAGSAKIHNLRIENNGIFRDTHAGSPGLNFGNTAFITPTDNTGTPVDATISLGRDTTRFKDGYFSGTVNAQHFDVQNSSGTKVGSVTSRSNRVKIGTGTTGLYFDDTNKRINPEGPDSTSANDNAIDLGGTSQRFKDAHFSGNVYATRYMRENIGGIIFANPASGQPNIHIRPAKADGSASNGEMDIGAPSQQFFNAHFSGTVNATTLNGKVTDVADHIKAITPTQIANWDAGTGGGGGATTDGRISDTQIIHWDQAYSWGDHSQANYQPAGNYATAGTSYTKSESDAKYELKGAGGLPAGDWHCTGNITAAGNITAYAASDERLKDDIAPMPLGLIDGINPVTFKWKDSGKSSGGVIAQQLQACGLGDWVNEAPNGDLGVDYNALVGVLLAEVLELKSRVRELEDGNP